MEEISKTEEKPLGSICCERCGCSFHLKCENIKKNQKKTSGFVATVLFQWLQISNRCSSMECRLFTGYASYIKIYDRKSKSIS